MNIKVKRHSEKAVIPKQAHPTDSGYDLVAINKEITTTEDGVTFIEYDTGISIEMPVGYDAEIFPRSSISKFDLIQANSVGKIDNSYRGTLRVRFKILGNNPIDSLKTYNIGDKVAQLIIRKTEYADMIEVDELGDTARGSGGFGSTDKK
jgi:dUTP pyrophosphatase